MACSYQSRLIYRKRTFGVTNRDDSIFVNKDARCRFAHNVIEPMTAKNSVPPTEKWHTSC